MRTKLQGSVAGRSDTEQKTRSSFPFLVPVGYWQILYVQIKHGWGWQKWNVEEWRNTAMLSHDGEILYDRSVGPRNWLIIAWMTYGLCTGYIVGSIEVSISKSAARERQVLFSISNYDWY